MNYPVDRDIRTLVEELHALEQVVDARLALLSAAALGEWQRMRSRIPSCEAVISGFVVTPSEDLAEMKSKIARLVRLLRALDPSAAGDDRGVPALERRSS